MEETSTRFRVDVRSLLISFFIAATTSLSLVHFNRVESGLSTLSYLPRCYSGPIMAPVCCLIICYSLVSYLRRNVKWSWDYLLYVIPALFFAFFMVEGRFFETDDGVDFFTPELFFGFQCFIALLGYAVFLFCLFLLGDVLLSGLGNASDAEPTSLLGSLCRFLERRPFLATMVILVVISLPNIVLNYPSHFSWDSTGQMAQGYGVTKYVPNVRLISEDVRLFNHHPVTHTLLIHLCLRLGTTVFHSWDAGAFIYTILQLALFFTAISYTSKMLIEKAHVRAFPVLVMVLFTALHPRYQTFSTLMTKDTIYCSFFMLLVCLSFEILMDCGAKRSIVLWCLSILGMILFRNDGVYLVCPMLFSMLFFKSSRKYAAYALVGAIAFFLAWNNLVLPFFSITPGSKREVLSLPFQQTACYLNEYPDDVTQEERAAIDAVLSYEGLAEAYDRDISDPVKGLYRESATSDDLNRYFGAWASMFARHPDAYFRATLGGNYQFFYPSRKPSINYALEEKQRAMDRANDLLSEFGADFSYPQWLQPARRVFHVARDCFFGLPIIGIATTSFPFIFVVIFLFFFAIRHGVYKTLPLYVLQAMQVAVLIAGPCNGYYFRYTFPIAICLPMLVFVTVRLAGEKAGSLLTDRDGHFGRHGRGKDQSPQLGY